MCMCMCGVSTACASAVFHVTSTSAAGDKLAPKPDIAFNNQQHGNGNTNIILFTLFDEGFFIDYQETQYILNFSNWFCVLLFLFVAFI